MGGFAELSTRIILLVNLDRAPRAIAARCDCYKQGNTPIAAMLFSLAPPFISCRPALLERCRRWLTWADFAAIFERDPAATNWLEVLLCYPGFHAIALHRLAHWLHQRRVPFWPRFIAHGSRFLTGVEIHPAAQLGQGVVIDHGMGVVIGETAIVGDYSLIYQGATLGGTGKETGKRHPTVGHRVVIGAGAKVLGNIHIGDGARIGAGSVVLTDVPSHCTAVGIPNRNVCHCGATKHPLNHAQLPDVNAATVRALLERIERLEADIQTPATMTPPTAPFAAREAVTYEHPRDDGR